MEKHVLVDWQRCLHLTDTGLGLVHGAFFTLQLRGASYFAHVSARESGLWRRFWLPTHPANRRHRPQTGVREDTRAQCLSPHG